MRKLTTEEFIERSKTIHGKKYDYSKAEYVDSITPVCIICPKHGEFWQTPSVHLKGCGCPKCRTEHVGNVNRKKVEEFIAKAKEIHGDKYDYSKVMYKNTSTKVCIICPEHGEFWQNPYYHMKKCGCPKCKAPNRGMTTEEFIAKAKEVHGEKYDYSKVDLTKIGNLEKEKVCIICPKHGEFWQSPANHLYGNGCKICNVGLYKEYKFNLLQEFADEFKFRAFLANNDINILQLILGSLCELEPKYSPIKRDIEIALLNASSTNPVLALEQKHNKETENEEESVQPTTIDLDNDEEVYATLTATTEENGKKQHELSIEDIISNDEQEIQVINRIEHLLTPDIRKKIMYKYLNDRRRAWMLSREANK